MFKNLKISQKLIFGFVTIALLIGAIGYYSIIRINEIQKRNQEINELQILTFSVIQAGDLNQYNRLREQLDMVREKLSTYEGQSEVVENLIVVSRNIVALQKDKLAQNRIFTNQYPLEKEARYNIRTPLFALNNAQLTKLVGDIQYYSKETLYQSPDQEHLGEWLEAIVSVRNHPSVTSSAQLVSELNEYEQIAKIMGTIAIEERGVEIETIAQYTILQDSVARATSESIAIAQNTRNVAFISIFLGVLLSFVLSFFISRSIARSVTNARNAAVEIARGNMDVKIDTSGKDEIAELSQAIDQMRQSLKTVMEEYEKKVK